MAASIDCGAGDRLVRAFPRGLVAAFGLVVGLATATLSFAQTPVAVSPDITIDLGAFQTSIDDHDVASDFGTGPILPLQSFPVPIRAEITAHGEALNGRHLLAFDQTIDFAGTIVRPGDVVAFDGSSSLLLFDAAANGVPPGARLDAVSLSADGLMLSFDVDVSLPGLFAADEDLVHWDGTDFSLALDGSSAGVPRAADIDGAQDLGGGAFLVSFRTHGVLDGVVYADEDILRYDGSGWTMFYDAASVDAAWQAADAQSVMVPEPARSASLAAGLLGLGLLFNARGRSSGPGRARRGGRWIGASAALLGIAFGAGSATADEGRWEINQTCAELSGCFPGDAPGFPVTIHAPGSYLLTSDLVVPALTAGIGSSTGDFTLDLGGFEIRGPVVCTGTGQAVSCDANIGSGIAAGDDANVHVFNGSVRGFGFHGIAVGDNGLVHDVTSRANGARGVTTGLNSRVTDVTVQQNGGTGLFVGAGSSVERAFTRWNRVDGLFAGAGSTVESVISVQNGDDGFQLGAGAALRGSIAQLNELTGIEVGPGCQLVENVSVANTFAGVRAEPGTSVVGSQISSNGGFGINFVGGAGSTFRANDLAGNDDGAVNGTALDLGNNRF